MPPFLNSFWRPGDNFYISVNGKKEYISYVGLARFEEEKKEKKNMDIFKVGDTVEAVHSSYIGYEKGRKYTVAKVYHSVPWIDIIDVHTGEKFEKCLLENFAKVEPPEETTKGKKILIMQDEGNPRKVIAKDLGTGEIGEAVCAPTDDFDFYTGAKLALSRLEKEALISWTGKVVCVESGGSGFTVGKVYSINDGFLVSNMENRATPQRFTDIEDLNSYFPVTKFIEFKGEA